MPDSDKRVKFKYLFAEPQAGETLQAFLVREEKAYQLRRDELRLAVEEGCDIDVDIEARLKAKGLA